MLRTFACLLFFLLLVSFGRDARADGSKPERTIFALIVTSNHGVSEAQPDLRYADDDGVKYLELFRMLAPEANVVLHTEIDRDTERLYPWAGAVARPPTKAAVSASIADLTQRVSAVTRAGGRRSSTSSSRATVTWTRAWASSSCATRASRR